jgi:hypothetical protein
MKKVFYLLFFVSAFAISVNAQVTIGSQDAPTPGAVLELKSANLGFLPTRVILTSPSNPAPLTDHVDGMVVFNTNATDSLKVGLYYNVNKKWVALSAEPFTKENWFYMPSIYFDTSTNGSYSKELYLEFVKQLSSTGGLVKPSAGAPAKVLATVPKATDLYYYVTAYDDNVFDGIAIDANGKMTYDIIGQASDSTFLNIVFVEK